MTPKGPGKCALHEGSQLSLKGQSHRPISPCGSGMVRSGQTRCSTVWGIPLCLLDQVGSYVPCAGKPWGLKARWG